MGYDLFDINSPFYQDICTPYKSAEGTDVPLSDRINHFYNNEETTCQSNCNFAEYFMEVQYLKCDCDVVKLILKKQQNLIRNLFIKVFLVYCNIQIIRF